MKIGLTLAMAGAGIYTPTTQISEIEARNILGNTACSFYQDSQTQFRMGFGLALGNAFEYPMVFPAAHQYITTVLHPEFKLEK